MGGLAPGIRGPFGEKVAVTMVTEVESSQEEIGRRTEGRVQIDFDVAYRGYGWVFPHRGYYSVGIGGMRGRIANPTQLLKGFLARHGFDGTRRKFRGHFIPAGGIRRTITSDRVLLVGDAAGFVDSFVGEGIGYAILSGKLAAETIQEALKEGNLSREVLASYQENCDAHFGERLRYAYFLAMVLHSLPGVFLRVLATHQEVVQKLLRVGMWEISYRDFLVWLLAKTPLYLLNRPAKYQDQDVLGDPLRP